MHKGEGKKKQLEKKFQGSNLMILESRWGFCLSEVRNLDRFGTFLRRIWKDLISFRGIIIKYIWYLSEMDLKRVGTFSKCNYKYLLWEGGERRNEGRRGERRSGDVYKRNCQLVYLYRLFLSVMFFYMLSFGLIVNLCTCI